MTNLNDATRRTTLTAALDFTLRHPSWALGLACATVTALAVLWGRSQEIVGSTASLGLAWAFLGLLWRWAGSRSNKESR